MTDAVKLGRTACRAAHLDGWMPIFPLLNCISYLTDEELERGYLKQCEMWSRRVSALWLCLRERSSEIDGVAHQVLFDNENGSRHLLSQRHYSSKMRLPVFRFSVQDSGVHVVKRMGREDIDLVLQCNVMRGLFRGAASAF